MSDARIEVGRLDESDLPALARLYRQFWDEDSSLEAMRATLARRGDDPDYVFVAARQDGALVGSALGVVCDELYGDCRPFMIVEDVVVDESRRRAGIGSAVMREVERRAAERNCAAILFMTEAERHGAVRFYESLGYRCEPYRGFKKDLRRPSQAAVAPARV
jgi:GNAT superfamily N-acetyltransferase